MSRPHMSIDKYIEYFRQLSANHTLVEHNIPQELLGVNATEKGTQSFHIFNKADIFAEQRSGMNTNRVNVFLARYEFNPIDQNQAKDYRATYTGAFTVVKNAEVDNVPLQNEVCAEAEIVVWDFIHSIVEQSAAGSDGKQCASPFGIIPLDNFKVIPIGKIWECSYGWHVEFHFKIDADYWMDPNRVNQNLINP